MQRLWFWRTQGTNTLSFKKPDDNDTVLNESGQRRHRQLHGWLLWLDRPEIKNCERMVNRHGAILLVVRRRSGYFPRRCRHLRRNAVQSAGRVWKRRGKRRRETGEGQTRKDRQRTIKHTSWMT